MIRKGNSLAYLLREEPTAEQLAWNHNADISASIYKRMSELEMTQSELANQLGMHRSQLSRLLSGSGNITVRTIARLETALDFRLDAGFSYPGASTQIVEYSSAWIDIVNSPKAHDWKTASNKRDSRAQPSIHSRHHLEVVGAA